MVGVSSSIAVGMVPGLVSYLRLCSTPRYRCGRQQVVTALSIPRSPPRSDVFIAVVPTAVGLPSHPSLSPSLRPPKQIELVVSLLLGRISKLSGFRPFTLIPFLFWCVRLSSSRYGRSFTVTWIRYPRYTPW